ncbi:MAG: hypothetical protein FK730_01925 [Asgard group archaeon]|nr:hypothetical protein [Asgard group archaeon]
MSSDDVIPYSTPNPLQLSRSQLSSQEISLINHLMPHTYGLSQPLFSGEELAKFLIRLWPEFLGNLSPYSLYRNLISGECYADREYFASSNQKRGELFLFRKGLLRAYPMPCYHTRFKYWYGYPRERYQLIPKNFRATYPPHDAFASWCFQALIDGLGSSVLSEALHSFLTVPHWDNSGSYVCDACFRLEQSPHQKYLWVEIHTGSEGFDEHIFLKRLLTMEQYLTTRDDGCYIILVPFAKDITTAEVAIESYNASPKGSITPLQLNHTQIVHYKHIPLLRKQLGLYHHRRSRS